MMAFESLYSTRRSLALAALLVLAAAGCGNLRGTEAAREAPRPVDDEATEETHALYAQLHRLDGVMFGHQDDLAYGVNWQGEPGRSDVREAAGAYPAVYGWELGDLGRPGATENLDGVDFEQMKNWIVEGYERGGVITLAWHMDNLATGGDSWDTTAVVSEMLPGGAYHADYERMLDRFADFARDLETDGFLGLWGGEHVPVIFRPFHEMSGSWFWWGREHVTPEDYKALWRFTVDYLRDEKDLHHLLYAYSPDALTKMDAPEDYYQFYPGDAYVDILGLDDYHTLTQTYGEQSGVDRLAEDLRWLADEAAQRGKVAAFSETGLEGLPDSTYWTQRLLPAVTAGGLAEEIAYVLVWRNAHDREGHFYAPYAGHPSAPDFRAFKQHPLILFEDELPGMYQFPARTE